jgi:hypothetical protein
MEKTVAGIVGAISGLAALGQAQASTPATPNTTDVMAAGSFAELLNPIPNARAVLEAIDAADAARAEPKSEQEPNLQLARNHHHHRYHHHHHHHHRYHHHHHHRRG